MKQEMNLLNCGYRLNKSSLSGKSKLIKVVYNGILLIVNKFKELMIII
ncbi:MAG TPA: hypothetical protein [Caudoviricetes sp.]|nr:MAG TPA: hypothetical protein [Caudoviricetes sp.]